MKSSQDGAEFSLPRLLLLRLKGSMLDTTTLTRCVLIPSRAEMQYDVLLPEHEVRPQLVEDISALLHPAPLTHSLIKTYEITISHAPDSILHIRCWEEVLPLEHSSAQYRMSPKLALYFSIHFNSHVGLAYNQMADVIRRDRRKVVDLLNMLSTVLPREQPHDLRWGFILGCPACAEILLNFPETRRIMFDDIHTALDVLTMITRNTTLLPHLTGICFVQRPLPKDYQPWPHFSANDDFVEDELLHTLASHLHLLVETREIHTLEFAGGFIKKEEAYIFEGIAKELISS